MFKLSIRIILALFIIGLGLFQFIEVGTAQSTNSVKDCINDPSKCEKDELTTKTKENTDSQTFEGISFLDYVKMIFALGFVIGLLYFVLKMVNKRNGHIQSGKVIQHLGGTSVGNNKSVQLIKVGDEILIVGVGENVTLLKEVENTEALKEKILESQQAIEDVQAVVIKRSKDVKNTFQTVFQEQITSMLNKRKNAMMDVTEEGKKKDE